MELSRRGLLAGVAGASALALAGCADDPLAKQYKDGSGKNYVAGDGSISEYAPADRGNPVKFNGATVDGGSFDSAAAVGKVVVVNFWYAGCAPCRAEAPLLQQVHAASDSANVAFVGVNVRDQAETARPFEESFGVTYPSIVDVNTGNAQLAFAGKIPPAAVPTTLVLDRKGRVGARVLGQVESASILTALIDRLVAEPA
ncbi:MAG TPA: TlpA disulfide reductase family protein [Candidatus Lumbricidophila sp.]|nr:TlpA disulfide reductase family protein [Candidatus Lumbricidophila sp.]